MKDKLTRESLMAYARLENKNNDYGASAEAIELLGDLTEYIGIEMYRPVVRLVLANWKDLDERIKNFTPEQWEMPMDIALQIGINQKAVALLIEVLEGPDTAAQRDEIRRELNERERKQLQDHIDRVRAEEAAAAAAAANK
ncbi:hypothetical protein [uncultured Veillonella sp.]|uniref:hypothetical protein n=1 Tax=uncultured Veillonella sp. TaxID=159268 RepID=UPI0025D55B42|nr:hypothetical protein [uncultured Veillonella sp.]MDY3974057.1 hypothetical protein [Veillonella caviae]